MRTLVLLLASTGMRIGALPTLKVSDLDLDESSGKIKVYSGTPDEYITFMTPECSKVVNHYLEFRKRSGEKIINDSPVIREQFDINDLEQIRKNAHFLSRDTYSNILRHALIKAGLRIVNHNYGGRHRHKVTLALSKSILHKVDHRLAICK